MATTVQTSTIGFALTFRRGEESAERKITFDWADASSPPADEEEAYGYASKFTNEYKNFIQPTGWRDSDVTEDEWTIVTAEPEFVYKSVTKW